MIRSDQPRGAGTDTGPGALSPDEALAVRRGRHNGCFMCAMILNVSGQDGELRAVVNVDGSVLFPIDAQKFHALTEVTA